MCSGVLTTCAQSKSQRQFVSKRSSVMSQAQTFCETDPAGLDSCNLVRSFAKLGREMQATIMTSLTITESNRCLWAFRIVFRQVRVCGEDYCATGCLGAPKTEAECSSPKRIRGKVDLSAQILEKKRSVFSRFILEKSAVFFVSSW